jgi:hypothetical protein
MNLEKTISSIFLDYDVYTAYHAMSCTVMGVYLEGRNDTRIDMSVNSWGSLIVEISNKDRVICGPSTFNINSASLKRDVIEHCIRCRATPLTKSEKLKIEKERAKKKDEDDYWFSF